MSDLERSIREAANSAARARGGGHGARAGGRAAAAPKTSPRRLGRLALVAVVLAAALAGAFAAGLAMAPGGATKAARADGPGFLPAQGWDTFQTGATTPPRAPTATAANVKLGPTFSSRRSRGKRSRRFAPDRALEALFSPRGESAGIDAQYRPRSLPLSLGDANRKALFEGQPPNVSAERLLAWVNGWNIDLFVFYGGQAMHRASRGAGGA